MTTPTIAIIGTGNMGHCIINGLIANGHPYEKLWASDPSIEKLEQMQKKFRIMLTTDNKEAIRHADIVILAIKPQVFLDVLKEIRALLNTSHPLIISIAAGIKTTTIQRYLENHPAIVRCMPNVAAFISCGATGLYANPHVSTKQRDMAESIMRALGMIVWLEQESHMDIVTALSGSGPAYFFLIMECLQAAAERLGLESETAKLLTLQTALGAARMALESGESLHALRQQVTSPGGTTEKGVEVLQQAKIDQLFFAVLQAAKQRAEELEK
ncbi:MAG: pyrroline-5-carboxylate reductase [Gammaproteobacteria bacterium RIFCSPHIGHO2_12_FULL_41_20]|nr:MAG: pyrroline-5-carboxylate reductase [Gammaproteobacteria bacterium RIFCSPHIGHO2_12_FULL_41_20]